VYEDVKSYIGKVEKSLKANREAMKLINMGIDYERYSKFNSLIPTIHQTVSGKYTIIWTRSNLMIEEAVFCVNFVIETAINLQQRL